MALGVYAGLAVRSIAMCGSKEQKQRWLPTMATMDKLIVGRAITGIGAYA